MVNIIITKLKSFDSNDQDKPEWAGIFDQQFNNRINIKWGTT